MTTGQRGRGGGVRCGYAAVATFGPWTLESIGPGLHRLQAECATVADGLLSLPGCVVWVPRGALRWEWTLDRPVPNDGRRIDCVVTTPQIKAMEEPDGAMSPGEAE